MVALTKYKKVINVENKFKLMFVVLTQGNSFRMFVFSGRVTDNCWNKGVCDKREKIMRLRSARGSPLLWRDELPDPTSVTNAGSSTELRSCPRAPREMATPSTVHYSVILTVFPKSRSEKMRNFISSIKDLKSITT